MSRRALPNFNPPAAEKRTRQPRAGSDIELLSDETTEVQKGVTLPFLSRAFGMGRSVVNRRLAMCKPIGVGLHGTPLYDLKEAAAYLVDPKIDLADYLSKIGPQKLPEKSREAYWSSKLKEQRYRAQAGEYWDTGAVIASVGELFKQLRQRLQLLPVDISSQLGLTTAQKKEVIAIVDSLQSDMTEITQKFGNEESLTNKMVQEDQEELEELDEDNY